MSNSSSEDENIELLKEAISTDFFTNKFYEKDNHTGSDKETVSKVQKPKSLRQTQNYDEQFDNLGVTNDFRNYVAKNLEKTLEKKLKNNLDFSKIEYKSKKRKGGIKFFSNSEIVIKKPKIETTELPRNIRKIKRISKNDEKLFLEKIKSIAVTPEYILDHRETKNWANRSKAQVFFYENKNGVLYEK